MKYLFSETGLRLLEALSFTRTLYAFDFDGTLAPICERPGFARVSRGWESLLGDISDLAPTAVISGRSLSDLRRRVQWNPSFIVGNHGIEGLKGRLRVARDAQSTCQTWKRRLLRMWKTRVRDPGVVLEDKTFTLALHYRRSRAKREARRLLGSLIGELDPKPRVIPGKLVFSLVPQGAPHKGVALLRAMEKSGAGSALYVGDDDTDEDVFNLPHRRILSVRVGFRRDSNAQYFLHRQSEVRRLLGVLRDSLQQGAQ